MKTELKRLWIMIRLRLVAIEAQDIENSQLAAKRRLVELAQKEIDLRLEYTGTLPIGVVKRWNV